MLTERLQRQHKLICAAIKAGRVDDLKKMAGDGGAQPEGSPADPGAKAAGARRRRTQPRAGAEAPAEPAPPAAEGRAPGARPAPEIKREAVEEKRPEEKKAEEKKPSEKKAPVGIVEERVRPRPQAAEPERPAPAANVAPLDFGLDILTNLVDEISALGEEQQRAPSAPPAPPPAEVVQDTVVFVAEPDIVEVEPLPLSPWGVQAAAEEYANEELYLSLLDDEGDFRAGQLATIKVHVGRGAYGRVPVAGAAVTVKVLGTTFRPLILTTDTDERGLAIVRALLPRFNSGRAALIIRATSGEEFSELRRIIHQ